MEHISSPPKILLVGQPGVGKTSVVEAVIATIGGNAGGFITREIRKGERRVGFEIVTLEGTTEILAGRRPHSFAWSQPFGRYNVNRDAIERVAIPALRRAWQQGQIVVIDEIGPMELLSGGFHNIVKQILDSSAPVLGTIMQRTHRVADTIKRHPAVTLVEVTLKNRDQLPQELASIFAGLGDDSS